MNDLYNNKTYFVSLNHNDLVCNISTVNVIGFIKNIINGNMLLEKGIRTQPNIDI